MTTGVVLVAVADENDAENKHPVWGDLLTLISALIYSFNTILLSKHVPDINHTDTLLLFGLGGLWQLLVFGILGLVLSASGVLTVREDWSVVGMILAKGLLDNVLTTVLWMQSVLIIGPTAATMGLAMQWPIAIGVDVARGHDTWWSTSKAATCSTVGCILILAGFVGINLPNEVFMQNGGNYHRLGHAEDDVDAEKAQ